MWLKLLAFTDIFHICFDYLDDILRLLIVFFWEENIVNKTINIVHNKTVNIVHNKTVNIVHNKTVNTAFFI